MHSRFIASVLVATVVVAAVWWSSREGTRAGDAVQASGSIDCTRGVVCPIIWHPPKDAQPR
jgi:hypothetical protein